MLGDELRELAHVRNLACGYTCLPLTGRDAISLE